MKTSLADVLAMLIQAMTCQVKAVKDDGTEETQPAFELSSEDGKTMILIHPAIVHMIADNPKTLQYGMVPEENGGGFIINMLPLAEAPRIVMPNGQAPISQDTLAKLQKA